MARFTAGVPTDSLNRKESGSLQAIKKAAAKMKRIC